MRERQVTGIAVASGPDCRHEHITDLYLENWQWASKAEVILNINNLVGDRYFTYVRGHKAMVVVVGCPVCGDRQYLRTSADAYNENNLLSLPRYRRAA